MSRIAQLLSEFVISCRSKLIKENETQPKDVTDQPKDLISDLPGEIIAAILERLPIQQAVKTSVLSKKWRYNWTTIRRLDFGDGFHYYNKYSRSCYRIGFENIINSVFHLHSGGVLFFELTLPGWVRGDNPDFDKWMLLLSKNGVKSISLKFNYLRTIKLPNHFFSCTDLTVLSVYNFLFKPPATFSSFKNLTAIHFFYVQIVDDVFETVVSGALQLETLTVLYCRGVDHMNVHAPNLRHMVLTDDIKTMTFGNMPHIESAFLKFTMLDNDSDHKLSSSLVKAVECWRGLKELFLSDDSFQVLAAGRVPKLLPTKFYHLKRLELCSIKFRAPREFYCALCLIKSSPNLQELDIYHPRYKGWVVEPITKLLEVQEWEDCSYYQLQTVRITWIKCVGLELLLLKEILRISPILERVYINPAKHVDEDEFVKFKAAVEQFDRASPKAKVIDLRIQNHPF